MLKNVFEKYSDFRFVFVQPGGNYGDYLIYWGAEFLADEMGLSYKSLSKEEFMQYKPGLEEVIYIHGGGGYNSWCSGAVLTCMEHALKSHAVTVIQGPCTIDSDDSYVVETLTPVFDKYSDKSKYFFTREKVTHGIAEKFLKPYFEDIYLEKDTALFLTHEEVVRRVGAVKNRYILYAFREDNESGDSLGIFCGKGVQLDPALFCGNFEHWVRVHIGAKKIITNRTHSSILGAILGKNTTLFPSRYHKNRSVWEYSLDKMGVYFSEGAKPSSANNKTDYIDCLPTLLRKSYKVERIFRYFQGVPLR